jgi:hypothetical protein
MHRTNNVYATVIWNHVHYLHFNVTLYKEHSELLHVLFYMHIK